MAAEPSAFGAGNLDSENPYGLTEAEKKILQNKQTLKQNNKKLRSQNSEINSLRERVDGLQSVLEAIAQKSQANRVALGDLNRDKESNSFMTQEKLQKLDLQVKVNSENIAQLLLAMETLSAVIDEQSNNYVTKEQYSTLVEDVNAFKVLVASELKKRTAKPKRANISNGALATQAKDNYAAKKYDAALNDYKTLISRKYKPAFSNYMAGQIYFAKRDYGKAIAHYKESASRYKEASYMPTLMLRTAYSMSKTGDKATAKKFYNAVIAKYPGTTQAQKAERYLGQL